ncbi:MAG: hypothetical protein VB084_06255 [Syntrophomonadaceae bacterium]|nr:hypothetical protein [Syntrophomonadaceae bacterium]
MQYRNFLLKSCSITLLLLALVAGFNFMVDPLQFYRQAAFYQPSFSKEQRYQNPGLAKNYDYDTIIIGSSMTENFVPSYINRVMGFKTLKLSMSAATAKEENLIMQVALRTGKVRNVILGLDYGTLRGPVDQVDTSSGPFPYYLYDRHYYNDLSYLLSITMLGNSVNILKNDYYHIPPEYSDLDLLNNWNSSYVYGRQVLAKIWAEEQEAKQVGVKKYDQMDFSLASMQANFDHNLLPVIRQNPQINFIVYHPPYSVLRYRSIYEENPESFANEIQIKAYVNAKLLDCPNVRLYDFQSDQALTFDLDKYKDYAHHSQEYNEYIIQALARQDPRYLVTPQNSRSFVSSLQTEVETLDVNKLFSTTSQ